MVPGPLNGQSWNRYSYVFNNPLAYTDPTGYCPCIETVNPPAPHISAFALFGAAFRIAATAVCTVAPGCQLFLPLVAAASSAFFAGVTSGSLQAALQAGVIAAGTAIAFNAVGEITSGMPGALPAANGAHGTFEPFSPGFFANVAGHALVGCGAAVASGSKCGQGALAAAVPAFAGPFINKLPFQAALAANTALGGLASVAGGGKFANGAVTGAFGYLFNAYQGHFHDELMQQLVDVYELQGWNVATEVTLKMLYDGVWYEMRADILFTKPDAPGYWVVDVKTGDNPSLTVPQSYILPGIANGLPVYVSGGYEGNHPITGLGFQAGQLLPPQQGTVTIFYQQNAVSLPSSTYLTPLTAGQVPYQMPFPWKAPGGVP